MNDLISIDRTLNIIFSDPVLVKVICSMYENYLTVNDIANLLDLDNSSVEAHLSSLFQMNLVKKSIHSNGDHYTLVNPKICDSILMLRDSIYQITVKSNCSNKSEKGKHNE